MAIRLYDAPRFGRAQRRAGTRLRTAIVGVDVDGRDATTFEKFLSNWRRSAQGAAASLSTTDGRWAVVSMSVTALVAGAVAWLAMGTMPDGGARGFGTTADRSLMPYQLFLQLASQSKSNASYASFGPTGGTARDNA